MAFNLGKFLSGLFGRRRQSPPAQPPAPPPPARFQSVSVRDSHGVPVPGLSVSFEPDLGPSMQAVTNQNGRVSFFVPGEVQGGAWVRVSGDGFTPVSQRYDGVEPGTLPLSRGDAEMTPSWINIEAAVKRRSGVARLDGRRFADDDGAFLAVGLSLFWAPWAYRNDPARLEQTLRYVEGRGEYVRAFAVVDGPTWEDRATTHDHVLGTDCLAGVADLCYQHGKRVHWTIFAGSPATAASASLRDAVVRRFCEQMAGRRHTVQFVEVSNEENDFRFEGGRDEMMRHAATIRAMLPGVPVALTSPLNGDFVGFNSGTNATIASCHLERDVNGTGGVWRPVRQAREAVDVPVAWVHGEPIGIDSSVASDPDPERAAMSAALTWLCRGAAYTLHTGAGIRGGGAADLARGRRANLWEQPTFDASLDRVLALRDALPADLPNWSWQNGNSRFPNFPFDTPYDDNGTKIVAPEDKLLRSFAALAPDGRFACMPIAIRGDVAFTARRHMAFDHRDSRGALVARVELRPGQSYVVGPATGAAAVFIGTFI